uniref:Putative ovule protein n=1 Tax=Solanum chacoense TaxID=4108 RepID=A0A0V0GR66_SOLCH
MYVNLLIVMLVLMILLDRCYCTRALRITQLRLLNSELASHLYTSPINLVVTQGHSSFFCIGFTLVMAICS